MTLLGNAETETIQLVQSRGRNATLRTAGSVIGKADITLFSIRNTVRNKMLTFWQLLNGGWKPGEACWMTSSSVISSLLMRFLSSTGPLRKGNSKWPMIYRNSANAWLIVSSFKSGSRLGKGSCTYKTIICAS